MQSAYPQHRHVPTRAGVVGTDTSYGTLRVLRVLAVLAVGALFGATAAALWFQRPASQLIETVAAAAPEPSEAPLDVASTSRGPAFRTWRDGMYLVGVDLAPGRYVTRGIGTGCYFVVATDPNSSLRSVLASHFGDAFGRRVELEDGQYFETDACGNWVLEATVLEATE